MLPRVSWLRALLPRWVSSGAATSPTAPNGLWTTGIKKGLAALGMQLGSRVSKACSCVTESPATHASCYSAVLQCSADPADHS
jgi:hypothetical protein